MQPVASRSPEGHWTPRLDIQPRSTRPQPVARVSLHSPKIIVIIVYKVHRFFLARVFIIYRVALSRFGDGGGRRDDLGTSRPGARGTLGPLSPQAARRESEVQRGRGYHRGYRVFRCVRRTYDCGEFSSGLELGYRLQLGRLPHGIVTQLFLRGISGTPALCARRQIPVQNKRTSTALTSLLQRVQQRAPGYS